MLFHTPEFLLGFLPLTLCGYFFLGSFSWQLARVWLAGASLLFYGWWDPFYVALILGSIAGNFGAGKMMERLARNRQRVRLRAMLILVVLCNLCLLVYFKYLMFFADEVNHLVGTHWDVGQIVLPIGISFYTFTQIAYLADLYQGKVREGSLLNYLLFVTYFPHLVAGPVLHHSEMMPQFADERNLRFAPLNFARGITFLAFGLCKKIVLADGCAPLADRAFAAGGHVLSTGEAWLGAVAYSLQIYYDFSGYCDMAIGLSLLFNIHLPVNFYSPYRSVNIIEFWRRWHITLSRFLRDYLYIPLGGNRRGNVRRYINLLVTMILGGVWHGANWTFLIWGGLHGIYLCLNHFWRYLASGWAPGGRFSRLAATGASWLLTSTAVIVAWVFFRAPTAGDAMTYIQAMLPLTGPASFTVARVSSEDFVFLVMASLWAVTAPNTNQFLNYGFGSPICPSENKECVIWQPNAVYAAMVGALLFASAFVGLTGREKLEFLYFQF